MASMTGRSLCGHCVHMRPITSARGSVFLLCQLGLRDACYAKYPPQPVVRCSGYVPSAGELLVEPDDLDAPPRGDGAD